VPDAAKGAYFPSIHQNGQARDLIYRKGVTESGLFYFLKRVRK
jgi:hypothetical protein